MVHSNDEQEEYEKQNKVVDNNHMQHVSGSLNKCHSYATLNIRLAVDTETGNVYIASGNHRESGFHPDGEQSGYNFQLASPATVAVNADMPFSGIEVLCVLSVFCLVKMFCYNN